MTRRLAIGGLVLALCAARLAAGQEAQKPPASITTPDKVETRVGALDYTDGAPSVPTAERVRDTLDLVRGDVGSQYLMGFTDADGNPHDDAKTYKVTLPKGIPARAFGSFTVYDNQTRSMLDTPQRYPRAGSQGYPSPAAEAGADGSTTIYFGPTQPQGVARGNWIQTTPGKGWFTILRLYSPLPAFFDKSWRPSEVALVK